MYRGIHIAHYERTEDIGFDGGSLNNEQYVILAVESFLKTLFKHQLGNGDGEETLSIKLEC